MAKCTWCNDPKCLGTCREALAALADMEHLDQDLELREIDEKSRARNKSDKARCSTGE